ncbi:Centromere-localized protein 2 [Neolecta irregularis DAH-3]|uniref:Centromere-localized protein 2 n=1 Tax=Neolecta irregularis (strain DAH-3) TaxID=1198029 RepID=A0A1U7LMQ2_NEOID|nr:Centromere-localized protein 2 [Neolecta irregularis DAH-3]|eukprot:OLL23935.1 Centromere-localized protein 2 [Neolecta irregularis DAH-3]
MSPPSESAILNAFLLQRHQSVISLPEFTALFPSQHRQNPQVKRLHRTIQASHADLCAGLAKNIELECRLGVRTIAKAKAARNKSRLLTRQELIEQQTFGNFDRYQVSLNDVLECMQVAIDKQQIVLEELDTSCREKLAAMRSTIDDMSDLRYGKLDNLEQDTREELENLRATCEDVLR